MNFAFHLPTKKIDALRLMEIKWNLKIQERALNAQNVASQIAQAFNILTLSVLSCTPKNRESSDQFLASTEWQLVMINFCCSGKSCSVSPFVLFANRKFENFVRKKVICLENCCSSRQCLAFNTIQSSNLPLTNLIRLISFQASSTELRASYLCSAYSSPTRLDP